MTQGDGMAEVTEADREKAVKLLSEWGTFRAGDGNLSIGKLDDDERRDNIAAALAEEREKAFNEGALAGMKLASEHREVTE